MSHYSTIIKTDWFLTARGTSRSNRYWYQDDNLAFVKLQSEVAQNIIDATGKCNARFIDITNHPIRIGPFFISKQESLVSRALP